MLTWGGVRRTPKDSSTGVFGAWACSSWAYLLGWRGRVTRPLRAAVAAVLRSDCIVGGVVGGLRVEDIRTLGVAMMSSEKTELAVWGLAAWHDQSHDLKRSAVASPLAPHIHDESRSASMGIQFQTSNIYIRLNTVYNGIRHCNANYDPKSQTNNLEHATNTIRLKSESRTF